MKKNERGIALITLAVIIIFAVAAIVAIRSSKNNIGTNSELLSPMKEKEDRSTYIPKCATIEYSELVENSSQYEGKDFTFTGQIIQVKSGYNTNVILRVNVTANTNLVQTTYTDTIYVTYEYPTTEEANKFKDGDIITIYGKYEGLYTYNALTGPESKISLPSINAMYIDIKGN